jgi:biopolymer transport protein ExbD
LGEALTKELELRPDWVVYVDADDMVSWSDVIGAMDIVRGRHAKIVLLARKKKKISSR